jgi:NAD(P)-dependent dehydrogenase (short-subunit alcohol dehydrogenase family)
MAAGQGRIDYRRWFGIGRATAILFAREGARVAIADIGAGKETAVRAPRKKTLF